MQTRLWEWFSRIAGDSEVAQQEYATLIERWSEPHRVYHTLEHLLFVLGQLTPIPDVQDATLLAAWYHDAVYDPRSSSNEQDSADLAVEALTALGLSEHGPRVHELIMMTAGHEPPAVDRQAELLLDADLAVLGQPPAGYLRYVEAVRQEYAHVGDEDFREGRSRILRDFLDRPRIYRSYELGRLEQPARANLQAELAVYGSLD